MVFFYLSIPGVAGVAMDVYVLYRNPNHWMDLDEIWQVGGPWGWEGSWGVSTQYPHPHPQVRGA